MAGKLSGPMCSTRCGRGYIDDGTLCRTQSPIPGPLCVCKQDEFRFYSTSGPEHLGFPIDPGAWDDIGLEPVVLELLPQSDFTIPGKYIEKKISLGVGDVVYRFYPQLRRRNGVPHIVFYVAYNKNRGRSEYVIGPKKLDDFLRTARMFAIAAGNFFGFTNHVSQYEVHSAQVGYLAARGNLRGAFKALGKAWVSALQDPNWWAMAVMSTAAALPTTPSPALARLARTQKNLLGQNAARTSSTLAKPTTFRHTLTADVPPASYAQIEKAGQLRLSSGGKAHYGEGVYAWEQGAKQVGKYVDIEVPAGTAAEKIVVGGQTWYRLVPASGDTLPVKIVGTNLSTEEIAIGRKLAGP